MSAIKLATPSSGSISLSPANTASNLTITVPAVTGTMLTTASAGTVLQVVNVAYGTYASTNSSTYSDTGLTASITPTSATNKILVQVSLCGVGKFSSNTYLLMQLVRNSTPIIVIDGQSAYTGTSTDNSIGSVSTTYLDSPATTSSTTYKIQFKSGNNTSGVGINQSSAVSTITLMEIAA